MTNRDPPRLSATDEFADVPSARTRHPVLALGVVGLAVFLVFHVRADLVFALSSSRATDLGDARALFAGDGTSAARPLPLNRLVRVSGLPDRESAVQIDTQGSWTFSQLFRVLGTNSRLYVHRQDDPLPASLAERDVFTGRLIHIRDLSFQSAIRRYYAGHVTASHHFSAAEIRTAFGKPQATVRDRAGDAVVLRDQDVLAIDVAPADRLRISLPRERFVDAPAARAEIERRGGTNISAAPGVAGSSASSSSLPPPGSHHVFIAAFPPDRRATALAELGDLDRRVEIRPERETHRVRLSSMAAAPAGEDALVLDGARVPLRDVRAIRSLAPAQIPADALLLIEGDVPRDHLHTLLACAVLVLFAGINLAGLRRGLKRT